MRITLWKTLLCTIFIGCLSACSSEEQQHTIEAQTIFGVLRLLPLYEHSYPGVQITNLAQVIAGLQRDYPYGWHERLKRFGKYAGFTNSIFEKYVFFPPGITNAKFEGELLLMNAVPYPNAYGEMERTIISKTKDVHHRRTLPEDRIQHLFKETGIAEPKPTPMPSPPAIPPELEIREPLFSKIRGGFFNFLLVNRIGGAAADVIWYIVLSLPFAAFLLLVFWIWRRGRN